VLAFVTGDLGFTGPEKEPQRIVQEGCLPIEVPGEEAEEPVGESPPEQEEQEEEAAQIEAVDDFDRPGFPVPLPDPGSTIHPETASQLG